MTKGALLNNAANDGNGIPAHTDLTKAPLGAATIRKYLLDTTLRDGEQTPGVCFSSAQKLQIAALLDEYGIRQIEAGIPAASRQEKETIAKIIDARKNSVISVWSRLIPSDIEHAIDVRPDIIHFSVPVSSVHISEKLRKDKGWVTNRLKTCLALLDKSGVKASAGFEDAFRADMNFMTDIIRILLDNGITRVRLADTIGVTTPSRCRDIYNEITETFQRDNITKASIAGVSSGSVYDDTAESPDGGLTLGIHAHNDLGMAVASTIEAAKAGCLYADVTVGGIGERAGNCDLLQLVRASSPIFNWGISVDSARDLQRYVLKIMSKPF